MKNHTMGWKSKVLALLIPLVLAYAPNSFAQSQSTIQINGESMRADLFDQQIEYMMDFEGIPGVSLAIIDNDKVTYARNFGYKRIDTKEKMDDASVFEAASLSKAFLVYVVHKLVDDGKLDLDKPMHEYLDYPELKHDPRYKQVTSRMVLSHSSGLENWRYFYNPDTLEFISNPGERFVYSGEGYEYLAKIAAKILGKSQDEYINEMVIQPLKLEHTFVKYEESKPMNFVMGHYGSGDVKTDKWKNENLSAASGYHLTAGDYARLITHIFKPGGLSADRHKELLAPLTKLHGENRYYGPGFDVQYQPNDTLVGHGGHNPGFTNFFMYSTVSRKGFVLLTNSDRGLSLMKSINDMTTKFDLDEFFKDFHAEQHPGRVSSWLKTYRDSGGNALFEALEKDKEFITENNLNELGEIFFNIGLTVSLDLLEKSIELFPESGYAYFLLGTNCEIMKDFRRASEYYQKAMDYNFVFAPVFKNKQDCDHILANLEKDQHDNVKIIQKGEKIEAEDFNAMEGLVTLVDASKEIGRKIAYNNKGNWVEYKISVPETTTYQFHFRVASNSWKGNELQFIADGEVLSNMKFEKTGGWDTWKTVSTELPLKAGENTLRIQTIYGVYDMNWFKIE
ncbi:MAG: serine hydrolase [Bacteroidota bacterium]